jgi:hypothetical protein
MKIVGMFALATLVFSSLAAAQATRTWVSGVGDDANPCSRTAPCKTFAGAISKTAAAGEIDCLDPGGFGALTITKSITIDCTAALGGVLVAGTNGITVSAGTSDVITLRGLDIDGLTAPSQGLIGISVLTAGSVHIENVHIYDFSTDCIAVNSSSRPALTVTDSTLSECGGAGVSTVGMGGTQVLADLRNVRIWNSGSGVSAGAGSFLAVRDSDLSFDGIGVSSTAPGALVLVINSVLNLNPTALQSSASAVISAFGNSFTGNGTVFNPNGGVISTGGDNVNYGNGAIGIANGGTVPKI